MAEGAQALADRFAKANSEFTALVEQIPEANWVKMASAGDPRQVGVVARHIAWGYTCFGAYTLPGDTSSLGGYFPAMVEGHPRPPVQDLDAINDELAREWQTTSKAAVLLELQTAAQAADDWVRGLTEEQLSRSGQFGARGQMRTIEYFIERILIGHIALHVDDIRSVLQT